MKRQVFSSSKTLVASVDTKLVVSNSSGLARILDTLHPDLEAETIDILENHTQLAANKNSFAVVNEDGNVSLYSLTGQETKIPFRSSLPLRDVCFTVPGMLAVGGDDNCVVILDNERQIKINTPDSCHKLAFNDTRDLLAISLSNGSIAFYDIKSEEPRLVKTLTDVIPRCIYQEDEDEDNKISTRVEFSAGNQFSVPNEGIVVYDLESWEAKFTLKGGKIVDHKWLGTEHILGVDVSGNISVWNLASRQTVWSETVESDATSVAVTEKDGQYNFTLGSMSGLVYQFENVLPVGEKKGLFVEETDLSDGLLSDGDDGIFGNNNDDGFIDDDDDAGYVTKRSLEEFEEPQLAKRVQLASVGIVPFSQGSTPLVDSRRYLTINTIGYVTLSHSSITATFFDRSAFRDFHFETEYPFDVCCLSTEALLLAHSGKGVVKYRPHEGDSGWTRQIPLAKGEIITSVACTPARVVVVTSLGMVRIFTPFSHPVSIEKTLPIVAMAAWQSRILMVHSSGSVSLMEGTKYVHRALQLPCAGVPENLFFTSHGDPVAFAEGTLLLLSQWRDASEARWVPVLDPQEIAQVAKGEVSVWPLGVTYDSLSCVIVRGGSTYPGFPLPLMTEIELKLPIFASRDDDELLEEECLHGDVFGKILQDSVDHQGEVFEGDSDKTNEFQQVHDRALLRLFGAALQESNTEKAIGMLQLMSGMSVVQTAGKIASRFANAAVERKVNQMLDRMMEEDLKSTA